jgi:hypothetical protein
VRINPGFITTLAVPRLVTEYTGRIQDRLYPWNCARCGFEVPRAEAVEDGFTGTYVCQWCYDPPDPMEAPPPLSHDEDEPQWEIG